MKAVCEVPDCGRPRHARGVCKAHYKRIRKHGHARLDRPIGPRCPNGAPWAFLLGASLNPDPAECAIWPFPFSPGTYPHVMRDGKFIIASRAILHLRVGPPPTPKHEGAHSCGNGARGCVNPHHLRWATSAENESDKTRHGTNGKSLQARDVHSIRALFKEGYLSQREIARRYGVSQPTISKIRNGHSWKYLPEQAGI